MFVIAVYDISTIEKAGRRRLVKVMKTMRAYLHHTQKSVFEGEITQALYYSLKKEISLLINKDEDYVVFYSMSNVRDINRENVGIDFRPDNNLI